MENSTRANVNNNSKIIRNETEKGEIRMLQTCYGSSAHCTLKRKRGSNTHFFEFNGNGSINNTL